MPENIQSIFLSRDLGARPAAEFFGRQVEREQLERTLQGIASGQSRLVAVAGPRGAGKSELLRQVARGLIEKPAVVLPLYLDFAALFPAWRSDAAQADPEARQGLCRTVLRQVLARTGRFGLGEAQWLEFDPSHLAGACHGAGLPGLAALASGAGGPHLGLELWREVLCALRAQAGLPVVLLVNGLAGEAPAGAEPLAALLEGARRAGVSVIFEAPHAFAPGLEETLEGLEVLSLSPLQTAPAALLVQALGVQRGWALPASHLNVILARLGPWPGWVRSWAALVRPAAPALSPVRMAEEAYVEFLNAGPWAEAFASRFERAVPLLLRERALRLARVALERREPVGPEEIPLILGVAPEGCDQILDGLTGLGLLSRQGARWSGPRTEALGDWVMLRLAMTSDPAGPAAARLALLSRLLAEPWPLAEEASVPAVERILPEVLGRFRGQLLPTVLLQFAHYFEAVGRLSAEQRRQTVHRATATFTLPEVIGVAGWKPWSAGEGTPPLYYARAYREGKYQRSHEEVWIAVDLSTARLLTTPEIELALGAVRALEDSLRPNRFVRWLILGEGASAEALEMIQREGVFCSSREQLAMIQEMLAPLLPRTPPGLKSGPEDESVTEQETPTLNDRSAVIEMAGAAHEPRAETSSLSLPARDGSELIAALAAEKIAVRADFNAAAAGQIKTSVLEGVLNAIEHSPNQEKLIYLHFIVKPEALEVTIENEGTPFDPLAVPTPDPRAKLASAHKRGWGLSLMKRFMDEVGYEPCPRGTRLRLVKRRRFEGGEEEAPLTKTLRGKV